MPKIAPFSRRVSRRVRAARRLAGLTLATVARRAKVSTATLSTLERGMIADPGIVTLASIAKALGTNLVALVGE